MEIVAHYMNVLNERFRTQRLEYGSLQHPLDQQDLLPNFEYRLK